MSHSNTCRVRQDELQHDRDGQLAQEAHEARLAEATENVLEQIHAGDLDSDMASYFDGDMLMRIARIFSTYTMQTKDGKTADFERAYAVTADDRIQIKAGIEDYAKDIAEMNL